MPSLSLFNRSWRFGSDDLTFPGIAGVLLRGSWLIVLSTVFGVSYHDISQCNKGNILKIFFLIMLPLLLLEFLIEICITIISMRGSIMNTRTRLSISKFVYVGLMLFIPEIAITVAGSVWIFDPGVNCDSDIIWSIRILIGFQWAILIVVLIFVAILFDPLGKLDSEGNRMISGTTEIQQALESQFQKACCCLGGLNNQQAFSDIARAMAIIFYDVDLVPSDIAAGLILMNREQSMKAKEQAEVTRQWVNERLVDQQDNETWQRFQESAYFFHFAMGSYGWPLYIYMNLCCGFCQLCKVCKCGFARVFSGILIEGDTCCNANTSGLIAQAPSHDNIEHVFSDFQNEVYQTPFCVSIDHNYKKVVICVRGTLSLKDTLTDLTAETETLDIHFDNESEDKCKGHRGMVKSGQFILDKLEKENILAPIFLRYPEYGLVVVGHSLGAGASSCLAILLKQKYNSVQCFAISPPPTLNLKATQHCEDFVTSVIVGNDIISRLSIRSVDLFKKDLIQTLNHCQLPKYQILLGGCWQLLCDCLFNCNSNSGESASLLLTSEDQTSYGAPSHAVHTVQTTTTEISQYDKLYCPGKILHLIERQSNFDVIHGDSKEFEKITVGPNMFLNHIPNNVKKAFDLVQSTNSMVHTCSSVKIGGV